MKPVHSACVRDAAAVDTGNTGLVSCTWAVNTDAKRNTTAKPKVIRRIGFLLLRQQLA
jgi:hypothetical protein